MRRSRGAGLMAVYNGEEWLSEQIDSVLSKLGLKLIFLSVLISLRMTVLVSV